MRPMMLEPLVPLALNPSDVAYRDVDTYLTQASAYIYWMGRSGTTWSRLIKYLVFVATTVALYDNWTYETAYKRLRPMVDRFKDW